MENDSKNEKRNQQVNKLETDKIAAESKRQNDKNKKGGWGKKLGAAAALTATATNMATDIIKHRPPPPTEKVTHSYARMDSRRKVDKRDKDLKTAEKARSESRVKIAKKHKK